MAVSKKSAENISKVLSEALPYIQKFSGKTIVIKYGGSAMRNTYLRKLNLQKLRKLYMKK